jgi:hypothetical protein
VRQVGYSPELNILIFDKHLVKRQFLILKIIPDKLIDLVNGPLFLSYFNQN